jgi:hypothetical protein
MIKLLLEVKGILLLWIYFTGLNESFTRFKKPTCEGISMQGGYSRGGSTQTPIQTYFLLNIEQVEVKVMLDCEVFHFFPLKTKS